MSLKLVSVNIEGKKHLKTVTKFLTKENADMVCLMEVREIDVLKLAGEEYPFVVFAPNDKLSNGEVIGVAILSKNIIYEVEKYYCGQENSVIKRVRGVGSHKPVLLMAKTEQCQVGAIHFTWTKKGLVDEKQASHMEKLLKYLSKQGEFVLCGDFNIPRGNELYKKLASKYKDNMPSEIVTTIDPKIHRANKKINGKLQLVVDYVFSTPKYEVSQVRVETGVSDHCAVVCELGKLIS